MKMNYKKWSMLQNEIFKASKEIGVDIFTINNFEEDIVTFGINWSAQGTKSYEEAKDYIEKMTKANEIAKFLTDCKIEVNWTEELEINDENIDFWKRQKDMLKDAIIEMEIEKIKTFAEI